jgi:rubredoxin
MKHLKFKCPKCKNTVLEEVMIEVVQTSSISEIQDDDGVVMIDYENSSTDGGEIDCYQCMECGYILVDEEGNNINDPDALTEWLKDNCKQ